jgi:hypothetical protein
MQFKRLPTLAAFLAALTLISLAAPASVHAANVNDLAAGYAGRGHHSTDAGDEDFSLTVEITGTEGNGDFTANFGDIPVSGRVTSAGVMTFGGKLTLKNGATVQVKKGSAQLSATGQFIVGSFQVKITGDVGISPGKHTFHVEAADVMM